MRDDLISRQRILNELDRVISIGIKGKDGRTPISAEIFRDFVAAESPIQLEQETGQWIPAKDDWFKGWYKCSNCDAHRKMESGFFEKYCPCCGAKMKG